MPFIFGASDGNRCPQYRRYFLPLALRNRKWLIACACGEIIAYMLKAPALSRFLNLLLLPDVLRLLKFAGALNAISQPYHYSKNKGTSRVPFIFGASDGNQCPQYRRYFLPLALRNRKWLIACACGEIIAYMLKAPALSRFLNLLLLPDVLRLLKFAGALNAISQPYHYSKNKGTSRVPFIFGASDGNRTRTVSLGS